MGNKNKVKLFLVDDDPIYLKLMECELCQYEDFTIETYATGELCIKNLSHEPDMVILDYNLNGIDKLAMNGLQTLDKIKEKNPAIQVVILSSQDKIEVAINCMHHKAFDYIVKSETAYLRLQKVIDSILNIQKLEKALEWYIERM